MVKHQKLKCAIALMTARCISRSSLLTAPMKRLLGCNCCKTAPAAQWPHQLAVETGKTHQIKMLSVLFADVCIRRLYVIYTAPPRRRRDAPLCFNGSTLYEGPASSQQIDNKERHAMASGCSLRFFLCGTRRNERRGRWIGHSM